MMQPNRDSQEPTPPVSPDGEAARWVVRRLDRTHWTAADEAALQAWLAESPRHAEEFAAVEATLAVMSRREAFREGDIEHTLEGASQTKRPRRVWLAGLAAAAAVAILLALRFQFGWPETISTDVAERREVSLEDGTLVELDAGTTLACRFSRDARLVEVKSGVAVFAVARDPKRPFVVHAGGCEIRDIGTTFSVKLLATESGHPPTIEVAVQEGIVEMNARGRGSNEVIRLIAGEETGWNGRGASPLPKKTARGQFASWREGRQHYREHALPQVIADLQRYSSEKIELSDERLRSLAVTGTLRIDRLDDALEVLRAVLPLHVRRESGRIIVEPEARGEAASPARR